MQNALSGREPHNDRSESMFGLHTLEIRRQPNATHETTSAIVAIKANKTVDEIQKSKELQNCIPKARRLQRQVEQGENDKLKMLMQRKEEHRQGKKTLIQGRDHRRNQREAELQKVTLFSSREEVFSIDGSVAKKLKILRDQLNGYKKFHKATVKLTHYKQNATGKRVAITGKALVAKLQDELLSIIENNPTAGTSGYQEHAANVSEHTQRESVSDESAFDTDNSGSSGPLSDYESD